MKVKIKKKAKVKSPASVCLDLWKQVVKKRANYHCEYCGKHCPTGLHPHHIIPSTYWSLRFDLENGVGLCYRHHIHWAHKDALDFANWIKHFRDLGYLEPRRHSQTKNDYESIRIYLEGELK